MARSKHEALRLNRRVLALAIALAIPAVLLGNGLWLLTHGWSGHAEYARPGFPDEQFGFVASTSFEVGLARTLEWFLAHRAEAEARAF